MTGSPRSASRWRSPTTVRESCSPTSSRPAAPCRCCPAARPPDDDALADLLARLRVVSVQLRDADPDVGAARRARGHAFEPRAPDPQPRPAGAGHGARADVPLADVASPVSASGCSSSTPTCAAGSTPSPSSTTVPRCTSSARSTGLVGDIDGCSHALHRLNRQQGSAASRAAAADLLDSLRDELAKRLAPRSRPALGRARSSSCRPACCTPCRGAPCPGWRGEPCRWRRRSPGGRSRRRTRRPTEHVALIAGPGLAHAEREVEALRRRPLGRIRARRRRRVGRSCARRRSARATSPTSRATAPTAPTTRCSRRCVSTTVR